MRYPLRWICFRVAQQGVGTLVDWSRSTQWDIHGSAIRPTTAKRKGPDVHEGHLCRPGTYLPGQTRPFLFQCVSLAFLDRLGSNAACGGLLADKQPMWNTAACRAMGVPYQQNTAGNDMASTSEELLRCSSLPELQDPRT